MRLLKGLVIAMAVVIVAGFAVVVAELVGRMGERGPVAMPDGLTVDIPAGARVEQMAATADRIVLHVRLADGASRLYMVDPASGFITGTIEILTPAGAE